MKRHRPRTGHFSVLFAMTLFVMLVLQCLPVVVFAAQDTPTTAGTSAQAGAADSSASTAEPVTGNDDFDTEQLEQLVAPIALYPDALLMQILMASTYPLEIVEADRWIRGQPDLTGDALDEALLEKDWDPSVKSLTTLPSVLSQMSENLDWTQDLGDAFLAQQNDLLDTAQRMRGLAYDAGNLETTEQQTVTQQEDKIIVIESSSPEVIYVPTYSPTVVYGPYWGYPYWYYPRWYYPPRPGYGFVAFGAGVVVGAAIWGGCRWGWGRNNVNININRHNEFNRRTNRNAGRDRISSGGRGGTTAWKHNSNHRKGVNYNNSNVAKKYGAKGGSNRVTSSQARGYSGADVSNRSSKATQSRDRSAASSRSGQSAAGRNMNDRSASRGTSSTYGNRGGASTAYSGSRSPSTDRKSSYRGASSRGASSYGGSRGRARSGGGRRR